MHEVHLNESEELQRLLRGCLKKDRKCQELLYRHYYSYGMSIAFRYAGNRDEAAEILNDSFLKVFAKLNNYDNKRSFLTWFRTIVINTAINQYKRYLKHAYHDDINEARSVSINRNAIDSMAYEGILARVQQLSPAYRMVFNMYVVEVYTHKEIAEELGISEGTSKSNLAKAKMNLRKNLQSYIQA